MRLKGMLSGLSFSACFSSFLSFFLAFVSGSLDHPPFLMFSSKAMMNTTNHSITKSFMISMFIPPISYDFEYRSDVHYNYEEVTVYVVERYL